MTKSSNNSSDIVTDAGFAVLAILPYSTRPHVLGHFASWRKADRRILEPALWLGEAVSVIRKQVFAQELTQREGRVAVEDLFALEIEAFPIDPELCRSALRWAGRLGQARAYDGFYLALSERLAAEFWTADSRLQSRCRQVGAELTIQNPDD